MPPPLPHVRAAMPSCHPKGPASISSKLFALPRFLISRAELHACPFAGAMSEQAGGQAPAHCQGMRQETFPLRSLCRFFTIVATAPYRRAFYLYTWKPIGEIRAANGDRKLLIPLVKEWMAGKYTEIQSVQVAATFCGGAVFSSLPLSRSENAIWISEALWFSSLICSICAIITSIQTKSLLDDLPCRDQLDGSLPEIEVQRMRRTILRYKKSPGIKHWIMVFIWQFPSMTMAYAWCTYLTGLTVYICSPFIKKLPWQDRHKVAIAYLACGLVGFITYISATIFVYAGEKDYERSIAGSRASTSSNPRTTTLVGQALDSNAAESGRAVDKTSTNADLSRDTASSTAVGGATPVQTIRSKIVVGFDRSEPPKSESGQTSMSLLY